LVPSQALLNVRAPRIDRRMEMYRNEEKRRGEEARLPVSTDFGVHVYGLRLPSFPPFLAFFLPGLVWLVGGVRVVNVQRSGDECASRASCYWWINGDCFEIRGCRAFHVLGLFTGTDGGGGGGGAAAAVDADALVAGTTPVLPASCTPTRTLSVSVAMEFWSYILHGASVTYLRDSSLQM